MSRLIIRQLTHDWMREREDALAIEVVSGEDPTGPAGFDAGMMDRRGLGLAQVIANNMPAYRERIAEATANTFPAPEGGAGISGGFPTNYTTETRYELGPGEAAIIEAPAVDAVYGNIQLGNRWGESLNYGARLVSYNFSQSYRSPDGKRRYVVAEEDPGVANWLDAEERPVGGVFMRWQSPDVDVIPAPTVRIVPITQVRAALPGDHPVVTPAERAQALKARRLGTNRRRNPVYFSSEFAAPAPVQ